MYEVKGEYWVVRDGVRQPAAPSKHFHTAMGMLRWALNEQMMTRGAWGNGAPKPDEMERVRIPYSGSGDWHGEHYFTPDQVKAMGQALSRYRAILRYYREVEPEWTEVSRTHYADNSIEADEINKYGERRRRMVKWPSGDACF